MLADEHLYECGLKRCLCGGKKSVYADYIIKMLKRLEGKESERLN